MNRKDKHIEKFIELAENLGWTCKVYGETKKSRYLECFWRPTNDEDFSFSIQELESMDDIATEVENAYEGFDVDDHVAMWLEAKQSGTKGIPGVKAIVEDACEIDEKLKELTFATDKLKREYK